MSRCDTLHLAPLSRPGVCAGTFLRSADYAGKVSAGSKRSAYWRWVWLAMEGIFACLGVSNGCFADMVNLGPAGDFNVFVFGDHTQYGTDVEGRVAVGGNAYYAQNGQGLTIGSSASTSDVNLIVGGNYTNRYHTLHGDMLIGGDAHWETPTIFGNVTVNGNATFTGGDSPKGSVNVLGDYNAPSYYPANTKPTKAASLPFDFADVQSYLTDTSNYLAALAPTGTTEIAWSEVRFRAAADGGLFQSFNISAEDLSNIRSLSIFAPAGTTVVVNVLGMTAAMQNMGFHYEGGIDRQHVLYNFNDAMTLSLMGVGIQGSILAPVAAVNFQSGNIDGTIIANSLAGTGESHWNPFQGNLPVADTPEPSSLVLSLSVLLAGAGRVVRRRKRAEGDQ